MKNKISTKNNKHKKDPNPVVIRKKKYTKSLLKLEKLSRSNSFSGYDPYDALNFPALNSLNIKTLNIIFTQGLVYSPINIRKFLRIPKGKNPKGIGLLTKAYCMLEESKIYPKSFSLDVSKMLARWLIRNRSMKYSNHCWGYNFPWQSSNRKLEAGIPTIVNSSFIGDAFISLYDLTSDKRYLEITESICDFILEDLHISQFDEGICFSYSPIDKHLVHNANVLGASLLAKTYSRSPKKKYLTYSQKAFDFTIHHQKKNGMWKYSLDKKEGSERHQIDWHQGFILDSIYEFIESTNPTSSKYLESLLQGADFYLEEQFFPTGRSKWRWPKKWPVDIHNQAQGIITLNRLGKINKDYKDFAEIIASWTINNMQDSTGFFYYQKWPLFTNKINYIRWGQSWMMLALANLLRPN